MCDKASEREAMLLKERNLFWFKNDGGIEFLSKIKFVNSELRTNFFFFLDFDKNILISSKHLINEKRDHNRWVLNPKYYFKTFATEG